MSIIRPLEVKIIGADGRNMAYTTIPHDHGDEIRVEIRSEVVDTFREHGDVVQADRPARKRGLIVLATDTQVNDLARLKMTDNRTWLCIDRKFAVDAGISHTTLRVAHREGGIRITPKRLLSGDE